jgi:acyl carrier protein
MNTGDILVKASYLELAAALATLDARSTGYQFDLERDIAWDRFAAPGDYFPADFLRDLGVDVDTLASHPAAWELFQWACALLSVEGFMLTEQLVVEFMSAHGELMAFRSNQLLHDEELKHIEMFKRFAAALRDRHPEWTFDFDRHFEDLECGPWAMDLLARLDDPVMLHHAFWAGMIYFEEVTVYMHARLNRRANVQPCWASLHECHMREEVQHLRTDAAHLARVRSTPAQRREGAAIFRPVISIGFDRAFATRIADAMVRAAFPELTLAAMRQPEETAVYRDILGDHPVFRRTRAMLSAGDGTPPGDSDSSVRDARAIERWLVERVAGALEVPPSEIDAHGELQRLALDSLRATEIAAELEVWLGRSVPATLMWDHGTLRAIAEHLANATDEDQG